MGEEDGDGDDDDSGEVRGSFMVEEVWDLLTNTLFFNIII